MRATTLLDFERWVLSRASESYERFYLLNTESTELGGLAARRWQYVAMRHGMSVQVLHVFTLVNNQVLTLSYAAPPPLYYRHLDTAQAVMRSVSLTASQTNGGEQTVQD